jgi:hypothetical protein
VDVREDSEYEKTTSRRNSSREGVIERDIEARIPDTGTPLVLYCGGGFAPRSLRITCKRWVTPMSSRWMAAFVNGVERDIPSRSDGLAMRPPREVVKVCR